MGEPTLCGDCLEDLDNDLVIRELSRDEKTDPGVGPYVKVRGI